jgi:hypothetical protein
MKMWIEVHEELPSHPKVLRLSNLTGYPIDRCVGKLVILWLWVGKQKEDGDISGLDPATIGQAAKIEDPDEAQRFFEAMIECRLIDDGVFLIHDWLDYVGRYLKSKYHTSNPSKWARILKKHSGEPKGRLKANIPKPKPQPLPTTKKDTQTVEDSRAEGAKLFFDQFWAAYPKKRSKGQAEKAFQKVHPDEQLLARMISSIERAKTSDDWKRQNGRYVPYPATWLNAKGWEDEFDGGDNGSGRKTKYGGIGITVEDKG